MNIYICTGNICQNPELKHSQSGMAICRFTVAINERGKNGEKETTFMNIVTFNKTAENCSKYLLKGSKVAIRGRIQNGSYSDKEGITRYTTEVIANEVEFLSTKNQNEEYSNKQSFTDIIENDLPF